MPRANPNKSRPSHVRRTTFDPLSVRPDVHDPNRVNTERLRDTVDSSRVRVSQDAITFDLGQMPSSSSTVTHEIQPLEFDDPPLDDLPPPDDEPVPKKRKSRHVSSSDIFLFTSSNDNITDGQRLEGISSALPRRAHSL